MSLPARDWPIPPMDKEAGDKDSAFTWEMGELILRRMAERATMKAITADPRMPAYSTVFTWVKRVPEFGEAYRQVRDAVAKAAREETAARRAAVVKAKAAARVAAGKRPRDWVSGRASTYSLEVEVEICMAVSDGASLSEVARQPGMPSLKTIYRWLRRQPEFAADFIAACRQRELDVEFRIELLVEQAVEQFPQTSPRVLDRQIRAMEARAGRIRPKLYRW